MRSFTASLWCGAALTHTHTCLMGSSEVTLNPSNAETNFNQSKKRKISENHLNPVMLVFIG